MYKLKSKLIVTLVLLTAVSSIGYSSAIDFINGSIYEAREKAGAEGKLMFVSFTASWCMPCRLMEETTYADAKVASYVRDNYVPVKVDIDDFDGYAYKQQYNVNVVPTIIVFDSQGKILGKYEEALAPSKMLTILKSYNSPTNRTIIKPKVSSAKPVVSAPVKTTSPVKKEIEESGLGLYEFEVVRRKNEGFALQVGVYVDYANVLKQSATLQEEFPAEKIIVHISSLDESLAYRLMIGDAGNSTSLNSLKKRLKKSGRDYVVRDLSKLK